jgi:hypothetical protein
MAEHDSKIASRDAEREDDGIIISIQMRSLGDVPRVTDL